MNVEIPFFARLTLLGFGVACLTCRAEAASASVGGNTLQLQLLSSMNGAQAETVSQGWVSSRYNQHGLHTNQTLQVSCRGLFTNEVYHLMGSLGTNGDLVHLSDFMPSRSGTILMQYMSGTAGHFSGTNNPGLAWGPMRGWTNHMSWVIFPGNTTNWCDPANDQGWRQRSMSTMNGYDGMGGYGGTNNYESGMGGWGGMGNGWPAMTNWWSGMSNWWPVMAGWCWDYTNMWSYGSGYAGNVTNWWGSLGRSAYHMMPMPIAIDQVPGINGLIVMDENLQPVLSADLANPDSFGYQARCDFTNQGIVPGAKGTLQASATQRSTHFALSASGLTSSTTYFITINDANVSVVATDANGRLQIRGLPDGVTSMKGVEKISILDRDHNIVLSTTLPPG